MSDLREFAMAIKSLRQSKGLTQGEAGDKIGVNRATIIRWEKGEGVPELENITAAADFYGVPARSLAAKAGLEMSELSYSVEVAAQIEKLERCVPEAERPRFRRTALATLSAVASGFTAQTSA